MGHTCNFFSFAQIRVFADVYNQYKRQESITVVSNAHLKFTFVDQVGVHGSPPPPLWSLEFKGGGHKSGLIP